MRSNDLRIECGAHGSRARSVGRAIDYRHRTAADAQGILDRHARVLRLVADARGQVLDPAQKLPTIPHGQIVIERAVTRDRRAAAEHAAPDWRRPGGRVRSRPGGGWLARCPEADCAPVTLTAAFVAAALDSDSGMTTIDISLRLPARVKRRSAPRTTE